MSLRRERRKPRRTVTMSVRSFWAALLGFGFAVAVVSLFLWDVVLGQ